MPKCTELQPWDWLIRYLLISSSTGVPNKFFICTQYIYEDYIITMNEMQCLITVLCCPLYMSVLQVM